jgi:hypothetical protein
MDAMPDGGSITITTKYDENGGVALQIEDTGFGIPEENLNKIFDPFFTTKAPGKGRDWDCPSATASCNASAGKFLPTAVRVRGQRSRSAFPGRHGQKRHEPERKNPDMTQNMPHSQSGNVSDAHLELERKYHFFKSLLRATTSCWSR